MGSKKTTTSNSTEHATTTPIVQAWMQPNLDNYSKALAKFGAIDPYSLVAGPSALQKEAFKGAMGLGGPMGWRGALQNGLGGGLQGLGAGMQQDTAPAPVMPQMNALSLLQPVQNQQLPQNVQINPYALNLPPLY